MDGQGYRFQQVATNMAAVMLCLPAELAQMTEDAIRNLCRAGGCAETFDAVLGLARSAIKHKGRRPTAESLNPEAFEKLRKRGMV